MVHPDDFVISLRSFQGGFELSDKLGITSPAYTIFNFKNTDNQEYLFWKYLFKTYNFIESLKTVTFGIRDGKSISFSEFSSLKINFSHSYDEQKSVGQLFYQLDHLIAANRRQQNKSWNNSPP